MTADPPRRRGIRGLVRRFWQPALWTLFVLNVLLMPLIFGGAGDEPFVAPEWIPTDPAALVAVHALAVAVAVPNTIFCLAAGFLFGLGPGMFYATLGTFLGSLAAFGPSAGCSSAAGSRDGSASSARPPGCSPPSATPACAPSA